MKALVCVVHGIGNCIRTLPLINALHELGYAVDVRLSRVRGAEAVFTAHPAVSQVFDVSAKLKGYDVACCTQICGHYHTSCPISKTKLMVAPGRTTAHLKDPLSGYVRHEVDYNLDLARELGYAGTTPVFGLPLDMTGPATNLPDNAVALAIGYLKLDGHSHRKHWGNENFARFAELLAAAGFTPVILGGEADVPDAVQIEAAAKTKVVNLCGKLSLPQTFAALSTCRAIAGNETMLVPAAEALDVLCLSLVFRDAKFFNIAKNRPYSNGAVVHALRAVVTPELVLRQLQEFMRNQAARSGSS